MANANIFQQAVLCAVGLCLLAGAGVSAAPAAKPHSAKKGFGVMVNPKGQWKHDITALNAQWFYSWGGDRPADVPKGVGFVPMDWGYYGNKDGTLVKWLADVKAQPNTKYLLGFNEPDGKDQANLSVAGALEGWPYLQATGLTLGSPAAVHADGPWMQQFMAGVAEKKYRVDFVTIHWYGGADASGFLGYLKKVHEMYHKPVWVTEFAPADWSGKRGVSPAQSAAFMREVLPAMDKLDYVQRYAWYSAYPDDAALGASALLNKDGSLTDLGKMYASL